MNKENSKAGIITAIAVIAGAIVVAAGVLVVFKKLCDKYMRKKARKGIRNDRSRNCALSILKPILLSFSFILNILAKSPNSKLGLRE